MKKVLQALLIVVLVLALAASIFACRKQEPTQPQKDLPTLAQEVVTAAFPEQSDTKGIADALLALLEKSELEEQESRALLAALAEKGEEIAPALTDLTANSFSKQNAAAYRTALQCAASTVSPEIAGSLFFHAAEQTQEDLPYTLSDCQKLSSLILGQDDTFGSDVLDDLLDGNYTQVSEKQINTLLLTLSSSLRQAVGISAGAKEYLFTLAQTSVRDFSTDNFSSDKTKEVIDQSKGILLLLASLVRDSYDSILSFTADFLAAADAKLFLGMGYEKKEVTLYYGYLYENWQAIPLTEAQFTAREGDYDEYISMDKTLKGFTVNDAFVTVSEEDATLADSTYRLTTAYRVYSALTEEEKQAFQSALSSFLSILAQDQALVAALLDRPLIEELTVAGGFAFPEVVSALSSLVDFDATDGVSESERAAAQRAINVWESYLHIYLPKVF